jgi:hypothetical protein
METSKELNEAIVEALDAIKDWIVKAEKRFATIEQALKDKNGFKDS